MSLLKRTYAVVILLQCLFFLNACGSNIQAPVESPGEQQRTRPRPTVKTKEPAPAISPDKSVNQYIVRRGDTLYSIAWNYGRDYRELAAWNQIRSPYVIYPGQTIRLFASPGQKTQPLQPGPIVRKQPALSETNKIEKKENVKKPLPQPDKQIILNKGPIKWSWPTKGNIVKSDTPISKKGIDIAGLIGQPVHAAAPGEVVYSGSGLLGYGRLIIIKHNDTYLSAYAHNSRLMVKEGDQVSTGQGIAQMGQTSSGNTLLHFEIRKNGKPVNPLDYLPKI